MATCSNCKKRGLFLRLGIRGLCKDCEKQEACAKETRVENKVHTKAPISVIENKLQEKLDEFGHQIGDTYTFVPIRVAGVTFKNGRRSRQTILRSIYWKDDPYSKVDLNKCIELVLTQYEGEPAVEVWVYSDKAREQIGYIPKNKVAYFCENYDRIHSCYGFSVCGGGKGEDGETINFGAEFTVRFFNKPGQGTITNELFSAFLNLRKYSTTNLHNETEKKAFEHFRKQYPHAMVDGWIKESGENGIIIYISQEPSMVVRYQMETNTFSISRYSDMY